MPFATPARYDRTTIAFHWLTAILVAALWVLGQTIDWFPKGVPRTGARGTHIVVGCVLLAVLVARIGWRAGPGRRLPPADAGWLGGVARGVHAGLYVLLACTVLLGVTNALVRGDDVLGLYRIPSIAPGNAPLRALVEQWHGLAANVLLAIAGAHAAAALFHRFVRRDAVLARMAPGAPR